MFPNMNEDLRIRPYRESDKIGVTALWKEAFPDNSPRNVPDEDIAR